MLYIASTFFGTFSLGVLLHLLVPCLCSLRQHAYILSGRCAAAGMANSGFSALERGILEVLKSSGIPNGVNVDQIANQLASRGLRFTKQQVLEKTNELQNDGHCYSTVDDYTFAPC